MADEDLYLSHFCPKVLLRTASGLHWQPNLTACYSSFNVSLPSCSVVVADVCISKKQCVSGLAVVHQIQPCHLFVMKLSDALATSHLALHPNETLHVAMLCSMHSTYRHKTLYTQLQGAPACIVIWLQRCMG